MKPAAVMIALVMAYRLGIRQCDCDSLRRRLSSAHRETAAWQHEARTWCAQYLELKDKRP